MRVDLRVKHDIEARKAAIGLFERGHGSESAAKALSVPRDTVRQWLYVYRSFGSEVLLSMDGKQARYTYEQKVAAASAVVDGGMSKRDAMEAFGVMSLAPLKRWCALYREGGAEALRPRPKGRPSGSKARPRTREQELEERCRRLETEVAYLKKLRALVTSSSGSKALPLADLPSAADSPSRQYLATVCRSMPCLLAISLKFGFTPDHL